MNQNAPTRVRPRVPLERVRAIRDLPPSPRGGFVVYWMTAFHRSRYNFALDQAVDWANRLGQPLLILEILFADYSYASDRLHRFFLEGMADNERAFRSSRARYVPFVERVPGEGARLLRSVAPRASVWVTDDTPVSIPSSIVSSSMGVFRCRVEAVDSNGLLPLAATEREAPSAYVFRRFLQKNLPDHLFRFPSPDPVRRLQTAWGNRTLPGGVHPSDLSRWLTPGSLASLPIDHVVPPVPGTVGGARAASRRLRNFVSEKIARYAEAHSDPSLDLGSGLSPYLHFGHLSVHEAFLAVAKKEKWNPSRLSPRCDGSKAGWWGMSRDAEAFLDELVTWREVGFHFCRHRKDFGSYASLPLWARTTLEAHASDRRPYRYSLRQFEEARTHDLLWNAAQRQFLVEGRIHNYLRMLWGKKILEWTKSPREALRVMTRLNDRWALDGRDPNSSSGIFWCLGRFDRPWAPARKVFGSIRYMSSANAARKFRLQTYLERFAPPKGPGMS